MFLITIKWTNVFLKVRIEKIFFSYPQDVLISYLLYYLVESQKGTQHNAVCFNKEENLTFGS